LHIEWNVYASVSMEVLPVESMAKNFGALVRQRIIPTERPPFVGEVSFNFSG
jgi:hypothetical protein